MSIEEYNILLFGQNIPQSELKTAIPKGMKPR